MNALLAYSFAHQPTLQVDFLVVVLAPPLRLLATGAAAPLTRKLRVNYGLGISGAWITMTCANASSFADTLMSHSGFSAAVDTNKRVALSSPRIHPHAALVPMHMLMFGLIDYILLSL